MNPVIFSPATGRRTAANDGQHGYLYGNPEQALQFHDGVYYATSDSATYPKVEGGKLKFYSAATGTWKEIDFFSITAVADKQAQVGQKKKYQIPFSAAFDGTLEIGIEDQQRQGVFSQYPATYSVKISDTASAADKAAAILAKVAANNPTNQTWTYSAPYLYVEGNEIGADFKITIGKGFNKPEDVVPSLPKSYYSSNLLSSVLGPLLPTTDTALRVIEITYLERIPVGGVLGGGSASVDRNVVYQSISRQFGCVFLPGGTNNATAISTLNGLLAGTGTAANYFSRLTVPTPPANQFGEFYFTVKRTDAGNAGATATAKTDYASAGTITRKDRDVAGGFTYYELMVSSATPPATPTAVGGDTVAVGEFGKDNFPASTLPQ